MLIKQRKTKRRTDKDTFPESLMRMLKGNKKDFDFLNEWEKLGKKINEKWDSVSLEEELKFQRSKNS